MVFVATYRPDSDDDDDDDSDFLGFATTDDVVDVAVSTDGTWQKRGHQSLFGIQAAISAVTGKVLDFEIQSRFCKECQSHGSWDRSTERFRLWKEAHAPTCSLNYRGSSNSMEQHGAVLMWGRSLELHKLRYTTFIGDGDSSSFKSVIYANHYSVHK